MRLAWFSPLPPATSGIATYSAEILPMLRSQGFHADTFIASNAHEFVWKHRRYPYDLTVFQMGNDACHDYMWAYLFRYPGLVVLHDAQLHQARALALTKRWLPRRDDYVAEFKANHPSAPASIAQVVAAGFGGSLYAHWPHIRLVVESARLAIVHNRRLLADLREQYPRANLDAIDMGVGDPLRASPFGVRSAEFGVRSAKCEVRREGPGDGASHDVRDQHGIPADAVLLAAFGGITPEKRIGSILRALSTTADRLPQLHLMLVGTQATHYDVLSEATRWAVAGRVHVSGYVADEVLPDYLAAADISVCLRWPTNRETSASWLRCLAAARPTVVSDLSDLVDVPTLDPRGWRVLDTTAPARDPVAISIDVIDEDRCLQLALERLAADVGLRDRLGRAARAWWQSHHQLEAMAEGYARVLRTAAGRQAPAIALPRHLTEDGSERGKGLARAMGVADRLAEIFPD